MLGRRVVYELFTGTQGSGTLPTKTEDRIIPTRPSVPCRPWCPLPSPHSNLRQESLLSGTPALRPGRGVPGRTNPRFRRRTFSGDERSNGRTIVLTVRTSCPLTHVRLGVSCVRRIPCEVRAAPGREPVARGVAQEMVGSSSRRRFF